MGNQPAGASLRGPLRLLRDRRALVGLFTEEMLIIGGVDQHQTRLALQPHFTESSVGLTGFGTF